MENPKRMNMFCLVNQVGEKEHKVGISVILKNGETWVFAVRLDNIPLKPERLKLRKDIALLALKTLGVLKH